MSEHHSLPVMQFDIDGRSVQSLEDFYQAIGEAVNGPGGYFGKNLDALNDCLAGGYGAESPCVFVWRNHQVSRSALGYQETERLLEIRIAHCHPSNTKRFEEDLERAQSGEGETVFDWIVSIFHDAVGVTLVLD